MIHGFPASRENWSPSVWREWIEIFHAVRKCPCSASPSVWREWIEIPSDHPLSSQIRKCLPPCGGSGLKFPESVKYNFPKGLPPCGGSGLKCPVYAMPSHSQQSPSVWREWIEISGCTSLVNVTMSPSVWREWIEISIITETARNNQVSLRVEGVD